MIMRTLIVDDEKKAREGLEKLVSQMPEFEVVGVCADGIEAIRCLNEKEIDLVLLDIQMPGVNGFDVLSTVSKPLPSIIFITAYDKFAIQAFEVHALDYLLKPFTDSRLKEALSRAKRIILESKITDSLPGLSKFLEVYRHSASGEDATFISESKESNRLVVKSTGKIHFISYDEIITVEADAYYIKIKSTKKQFLIRESLGRMQSQLPDKKFIRVHKPHIINKSHIIEIEHLKNGEFLIELC